MLFASFVHFVYLSLLRWIVRSHVRSWEVCLFILFHLEALINIINIIPGNKLGKTKWLKNLANTSRPNTKRRRTCPADLFPTSSGSSPPTTIKGASSTPHLGKTSRTFCRKSQRTPLIRRVLTSLRIGSSGKLKLCAPLAGTQAT